MPAEYTSIQLRRRRGLLKSLKFCPQYTLLNVKRINTCSGERESEQRAEIQYFYYLIQALLGLMAVLTSD